MARWAPDARGRLERAALDLFAEQGFAETTVPQITARAGLTTRTFFRHFADKREALFSGEEDMRAHVADIVRAAPHGLPPMELVEHVLEAVAGALEPRFDYLRRWRAIVGEDEALRERGLRKQQLITESAVAALGERGFDERTAGILARLATTLLNDAVSRWVEQPGERHDLATFVRDSLDHFRSLVA